MKKAAMFGLDARIALAIFGALSVISGAALYSAIQNAKVTQAVTIFAEVTKAIESYALDTGTIPGPANSSFLMDMGLLVSDTKSGWSGPYISLKTLNYSSICTDCTLEISAFDTFLAGRLFLSDTDGFTLCSTGANCSFWIHYENMPLDFAKSMDERIDGTLDENKGKLRYSPSSPVNIWYNTGLSVGQF